MPKRIVSALLLVSLSLALCLPARGAEPELELESPSAILMDAATGTVLFEQDADTPMEPASVTKVMTLLLVMEALDRGEISMDDRVVASETAAAKGGSQVYLEPGEEMSMDEMLKSVVVASANDCATALAEHLAGSEAAFVERMNRRAEELGMTNTHFVNCTGLCDEAQAKEHRTTARDIALMSRALLTHDRIRSYTTIWMDTVRDGRFGLSNTNKLVRFYKGTTGLKTGYTSTAGHCLSASAQRDGIELIAVVLGAKTSSGRFADAKALLDYGFAGWALVTPDLDVELPPVPVELGQADTATPVLSDAGKILIEKGQQSQITRETELEPSLTAPVRRGDRLGTLTVKAGDQVLKTIPLVAEQDVARLTAAQILMRLFKTMCGA